MRPPFKVRHEPPTLAEALYAAQGITTDLEQQIELAAELMKMPPDAVRAEFAKSTARPPARERVFVPARSGMQRAVVITTTGRPRNRQNADFTTRGIDRGSTRSLPHNGTPRPRYPS